MRRAGLLSEGRLSVVLPAADSLWSKNGKGPVFKRVGLKDQRLAIAAEIAGVQGISSLAAQVLAARGFTVGEDLVNYLEPTLQKGLPHPEQLLNLDHACELVKAALAQEQLVAICCDFDVDGLSGGALLHNFFRDHGITSQVFVPDRFEDGYGLNEKMVREAAERGFKLLIAVDYGTTCHFELELARTLGLKTIVVDHHHVASIPPADVFINPEQPGCGFADGQLCAAALVWYLVIGLKRAITAFNDVDVRKYLDLACLGTICDMVPLLGPNRVIALRGLEALTTTKRIGLQALKKVVGANEEVSSFHVGFGIGPRINAAGRMEHPSRVIDLLSTDNSKVASRIARKLDKLNSERQDIESQILTKATFQVEAAEELPYGIVAWGEDFHTGVVGIVAQRLAERFYRPSIVMGCENGSFRGSARGIDGFDVIAALTDLAEHFERFGGHQGAGGFTLKSSPSEFALAFNQLCRDRLERVPCVPVVLADTEVTLSDITPSLINELEGFAPFGIGNPAPQLLVRQVKVSQIRVIKESHLKANFSDGQASLSGMLWRYASHPALKTGAVVDIVCRPTINRYQGQAEVQLTLQAVEEHR